MTIPKFIFTFEKQIRKIMKKEPRVETKWTGLHHLNAIYHSENPVQSRDKKLTNKQSKGRAKSKAAGKARKINH